MSKYLMVDWVDTRPKCLKSTDLVNRSLDKTQGQKLIL